MNENLLSLIEQIARRQSKIIGQLQGENAKLGASKDRLEKALRHARLFIEYARYELEPKAMSGMQFPSQECADKEMASIDEALAGLTQPAPEEKPE